MRLMFEDVLVATDGSERAERAAEHAIELADSEETTLHALYVMDMGDADFVATPNDIAETRSRLEGKGEEFTDDVAGIAADADIECVTAVRSGVAPEEIVGYADENDVDCIVLGKRGQSDPDKPAFGSITGRVIGLADVPVNTV